MKVRYVLHGMIKSNNKNAYDTPSKNCQSQRPFKGKQKYIVYIPEVSTAIWVPIPRVIQLGCSISIRSRKLSHIDVWGYLITILPIGETVHCRTLSTTGSQPHFRSQVSLPFLAFLFWKPVAATAHPGLWACLTLPATFLHRPPNSTISSSWHIPSQVGGLVFLYVQRCTWPFATQKPIFVISIEGRLKGESCVTMLFPEPSLMPSNT